jgi:hypothetical protein
MKKIAVVIVILFFVIMVSGCGESKTINGIEYDTYGLFNKADYRNPEIKYNIIVGNIVWSAILVETIIIPIYFMGFSLYEPVRAKTEKEISAIVSR